MDWKEYERQIFAELRSRYPDATVSHDARIQGRRSKTERQVDILIEQHVADAPIRIVVDTKLYSKPIDVPAVEAFIAMMGDLGAHKGILVSLRGYSEAALELARNCEEDVELEVFSLDELKAWQSSLAIPYAGNHGVFLRAPFGWVVDITGSGVAPACLFQRGLDLKEAMAAWDWAYVNFWHRRDPAVPDLDALCRVQDGSLLAKTGTKISYLSSPLRRDGATRIRRASIPSYKGLEITGFIEFSEFIVFCVFHCDEVREKMALRKLRGVVREAQPLKITVTPDPSGLRGKMTIADP